MCIDTSEIAFKKEEIHVQEKKINDIYARNTVGKMAVYIIYLVKWCVCVYIVYTHTHMLQKSVYIIFYLKIDKPRLLSRRKGEDKSIEVSNRCFLLVISVQLHFPNPPFIRTQSSITK